MVSEPVKPYFTRGIGVDTAEYETIDITLLRRGVIGVNKIGYVFQ